MSNYYDQQGNPMELMDWAQAFETDDRVVASDYVGDVHVSTVWLGLDHQYGDGPPLIFETMIFGGELDGEQWRDSTEEQAKDSHAHAVAQVAALRVGASPVLTVPGLAEENQP